MRYSSPMKAKVFNISSAKGLEKQIHDWLDGNPGAVISQATQSESGTLRDGDFGITLTILYTDGN